LSPTSPRRRNTDAEADRLAQIMTEELIQFVDIGRDPGRRLERLAARGLVVGCEPNRASTPSPTN